MNQAFPVYHPCHIERINGEYVHHIGSVDYEQVVCSNCLSSFTHWIDLWKYHSCKTKTQEGSSS